MSDPALLTACLADIADYLREMDTGHHDDARRIRDALRDARTVVSAIETIDGLSDDAEAADLCEWREAVEAIVGDAHGAPHDDCLPGGVPLLAALRRAWQAMPSGRRAEVSAEADESDEWVPATLAR